VKRENRSPIGPFIEGGHASKAALSKGAEHRVVSEHLKAAPVRLIDRRGLEGTPGRYEYLGSRTWVLVQNDAQNEPPTI
jgi:hypothetical protein